MPDVFREAANLPEVFAGKARVLERARRRGFEIVHTAALVEAYRRRHGSLVAGMALYMDYGHFSREGTRVLAEAAAAPPSPASGRSPATPLTRPR